MATVSGAERNKNMEQIQQIREEYQKKDAEQARKHKEEIQNIVQRNQDELDKTSENYEKQLGDLKNRNKDFVSQRDQDYLQKIEKIQELSRKQMREVAEKNDRERKALIGAYRSDAEKLTEVNQQQTKALRDSYSKQLEDKDVRFGKLMEGARQTSDQAREQGAQKLQDKFAKEITDVRAQRDNKVQEIIGERDEWRRAKDSQINQLKRHLDETRSRLTSNFEENVADEKRMHVESLEYQREGYGEGLKQLRERYNQALANKREEDFKASEEFKSNTSERFVNNIQRLKNRIRELEQQVAYERSQSERQTDTLLKHQTEAYQKQIDIYKDNKDKMVEDFNDLSRRDIQKLTRQNSMIVHDTNKFYQDKIDTAEVKQKEAFDQVNIVHQTEKEHLKSRSKARIERILADSEQTKEKLQNFFQDSIQQTKDTWQNKVKEERLRNITERGEASVRMTKQMQTTEEGYLDKLTRTIKYYQGELDNMRSTFRREMQKQKELEVTKLKQLQKTQDMAMKSKDLQHGQQIEKIREKNQQEIDTMRKRHEEEINQLISVKKNEDEKPITGKSSSNQS